MNKKILCLVISLCIIFSSFAAAADFSDVPSDSEYYDAISHLADKGIINGYSDGTFKPSGNITRAEASAIIVRSAELDSDSAPSTIYRDVPENHWARGYIMAATEAKILDGFGNGIFSPSGNVTYNQIIKMIVCMIGKEDSARELGGWPMGYVDVALELDIIDRSTYSSILYKKLGDSPAPRGDVALFIYNALESVENNTLRVNNEEFVLGMSAESLGSPDEILSSSANFRWYVYNTDTYKNFYAIGVDKNHKQPTEMEPTHFAILGRFITAQIIAANPPTLKSAPKTSIPILYPSFPFNQMLNKNSHPPPLYDYLSYLSRKNMT